MNHYKPAPCQKYGKKGVLSPDVIAGSDTEVEDIHSSFFHKECSSATLGAT